MKQATIETSNSTTDNGTTIGELIGSEQLRELTGNGITPAIDETPVNRFREDGELLSNEGETYTDYLTRKFNLLPSEKQVTGTLVPFVTPNSVFIVSENGTVSEQAETEYLKTLSTTSRTERVFRSLPVDKQVSGTSVPDIEGMVFVIDHNGNIREMRKADYDKIVHLTKQGEEDDYSMSMVRGSVDHKGTQARLNEYAETANSAAVKRMGKEGEYSIVRINGQGIVTGASLVKVTINPEKDTDDSIRDKALSKLYSTAQKEGEKVRGGWVLLYGNKVIDVQAVCTVKYHRMG